MLWLKAPEHCSRNASSLRRWLTWVLDRPEHGSGRLGVADICK